MNKFEQVLTNIGQLRREWNNQVWSQARDQAQLAIQMFSEATKRYEALFTKGTVIGELRRELNMLGELFGMGEKSVDFGWNLDQGPIKKFRQTKRTIIDPVQSEINLGQVSQQLIKVMKKLRQFNGQLREESENMPGTTPSFNKRHGLGPGGEAGALHEFGFK